MPIPDDLNDLLDNDDVDEIFTLEEEIAAGSFGTVYQVPAHAHTHRDDAPRTRPGALFVLWAPIRVACSSILDPPPTTAAATISPWRCHSLTRSLARCVS